ncbi:Putative metabolite transport protein NicT [Pandoraea terrae]|uniref:Metabolite transport protein NicT n=1 Tax=Pandoraea terrae TaxID=1537710 RepID=A0A5E4V420_9BURK|nr:MFS transporter [Pandoraea terrae]VVE06998.1 Putative metabolite transport protein NicT [Pandoraea terrae]
MAISNGATPARGTPHTPTAHGAVSAQDADALYRKLSRRIIPLILLCYFFGYLDRVNVGFAKLQMVAELQLSEAAYGVGAGLFFLGYLLLQVPAGYLVQRIGVKKCLAGSMLTWGIVSVATLATVDQTSFYLLRFLLGVTEASFFPAVIAYFSVWFPSRRLSKVMALLFLAMPLGVIVGGPLSGWIMDATHGGFGLKGWQWMFLIEGLPAVLLGFYLLATVTERVEDAAWLTDTEKRIVQREMAQEATGKRTSLGPAMREPTLWILFATSFLYNVGNYGLVFWMPTMIKALGTLTNFQIGMISAIPYLVASIAMVLNAQHSVKTGERRWHTAVPVFIGGVALLASVGVHAQPVAAVACLTVGVAGIMSTLAMFWSLPSRILAGTAAAGGAGIVNIGAAVAGFVGPSIMGYLKGLTGSTEVGVALLAVTLFAAAALILSIPRRFMRNA